MEEKELFENYEHNVWEFTPNFYKIIGLAVVLNFLGLFAIGQFNIFSTRGCDTPYVGIVCQAMDSAYIASVFYGKGFEADSIDYKKTEISDDEVVTVIDVTDQLKYPDGYFALANPSENSENSSPLDSFNPTTDPLAPTPSQKVDDMGVQVLPTPNNDVSKQDSADLPFKIGGDDKPSSKTPSIAKVKTPKPNKTTLPNTSPTKLPGDNEIASKDGGDKTPIKPTPSPTPTPDAGIAKDEFNQKFNKKPLQDFADGVLAKLDSTKPEDKVDLTQQFTVILDGTLTDDGKFDTKKTRFTKSEGEGDKKMVDVAKSAIEAIGDSTLFSYLKALGVDQVNITLVQDDKQIYAIIKSSQPSVEKAKSASSGFNTLISLANINTKDDKEVQALLKATKVKAEGKSFVINFAMPKDDAHKLIDQKLGEARQKKLQNNSDGTKPETEKGK
ncbi:MAG TPA: hypothetical protein PKY82_16790 [Pyrinomonadaceae bacterium]|nr:hypothetical protein [Pyrinomonadaceae bacterium]